MMRTNQKTILAASRHQHLLSRAHLGLLALLALAGVVACGSGATESASISTILSLTADTKTGETLFTSNCVRCHGTNATSGIAGKDLPSIATQDATAAIDQIQNGGDGMPAFSSLGDQDIADIVGYLRSL